MRIVWRLVTHHKDQDGALDWATKNRRLAIGWGETGDVKGKTAEQISEIINQRPSGGHTGHLGGPSLYDFLYCVRLGDLVILSTGEEGERKLVMEVVGEYEYVDQSQTPFNDNYQHQRKARIVDMDPNALWRVVGDPQRPGQGRQGQVMYRALIQCAKSIDDLSLASMPCLPRLDVVK